MDDKIASTLDDLLKNNESFKTQVQYNIKTYKPKDKILRKGKTYPYFCYLRKGTVRVVLSDKIEKALHPIVSDIYPNEIFGAMGGFHKIPANADVIAVTESIVVEIITDSLQSFIEKNPKLGNQILMDFISTLFGRINRMNERVLSLLKQALDLKRKI